MKQISFQEYKNKVMGCWWGKIAGGTLGAPFECYRGVLDLDFYTQKDPSGIPNDDLDVQIMALRAVEKYGNKINSHILGEFWLNYVSASMSEYGAGKNNLRYGIAPPLSGNYNNLNRNSCGAYIRSELWACLCAAHPELAVEYAMEDAMVDHAGEGVYGEIFCAALESAAFVENDIHRLISIAQEFIPADCGIAKGVNKVLQCYKEGKDWKTCRKEILKTVPGSFGCIEGYLSGCEPETDLPQAENGYDAPSNVAIGVLGLVYGEKDFAKTLCITAGCCEDADCTTGLVGAVLGILLGYDKLPEKWIKPLGEKISTWCLRVDLDLLIPQSVSELCERVLRLTPSFLGSNWVDTIHCRNGYSVLYDSEKFGKYEKRLNYFTEVHFSDVLMQIPDTVHYRGVLFDTYVKYDGGIDIKRGELKKIKIEFHNNIRDQQWLILNILGGEGIKVFPGREISVSLDQLHGGMYISQSELLFSVEEFEKAKAEIVMQITSNGRYTREFIPIILRII